MTQEQAAKRLHRVVLEDKIKQLRAAEAELMSMQKGCTHEVFNDTEGYPYHFRTCYVCNTLVTLL